MVENLTGIDVNEFVNPPKKYRPIVRWWWTGTDIEKDELIREVGELDEAGFLGAEIQCFMIHSPFRLEKKDPERAKRSHRFMQPYYYQMLKAVLDEAEKREMVFDITENSSWPAGGVHITKEDSMKTLLFNQKVIKGGKKYKGKLPKFKKTPFYRGNGLAKRIIKISIMEFFPKDMKLKAVIAGKPLGKPGKIHFIRKKTGYIDFNSVIDITEKVNENGILEWDVPEGKWQIFAFYEGPSGARPLLDSRSSVEGESLVLDHFASDSIKNHIDAHLGEGEKYFKRHFGKTLRAFFTDSLELSAEWLWTNKFLEEFKKRRGYDITPYLPVCYIPNRDNKYLLIFLGIGVPSFEFKEGLGKRIRYDYENTISDLFCDEYVQTMANWAKNHNIKSRIQAYGIRADVLKAYGISHIPETEQLYAGGSIDFLKFAGSAAAIYEKPLVTAESLVWNRRDYLTTPLKWKVGADRLFISGINEMIYHGFPYNNPAFSYPGFHGFSTRNLPRMVCFSSNMGRMNPFWKFFPIMNSYITRCQYTLQRGKTVSKIGIYYPLFNYCDSTLKLEELTGGVLDEFDLNLEGKTTGGSLKKIEKFDEDEQWTYSQIKISDNLMENGHFYVHVNEDSLLKANLEGKILHVGICKLEVLIFHNIESITLELSQKLENLVKAGFPVVFINKIPDSQPGFYNYRESEEKIRDIFNNEIKDKIFFIQDSLEVGKYISEELKIEPQVIFENSQPTIHYIHKKTETSEIYFLRHSKNTPHKITAKFKHSGKVPYIYDPWNGKMAQKGQYKIEEEYISMELYFDAYGSIILEFKDGEEEIYLEETSIQVDREDGKLTGYISQPGEYLFNLSNGDQKIIEVDNGELIPPLTVYNWNFEAQIREYTGETRSIRMNLDQIRDWREISELKYCSAKGIYKTTINLDSKYFNNDSEKTSRLILSLGRLGDVAELKINDEELQPIMQYPFETDITDYVKEGDNDLKITVTPTLMNRLVGYSKKGGKEWKNHKKRPLMPSGLLEPVKIVNKLRINL